MERAMAGERMPIALRVAGERRSSNVQPQHSTFNELRRRCRTEWERRGGGDVVLIHFKRPAMWCGRSRRCGPRQCPAEFFCALPPGRALPETVLAEWMRPSLTKNLGLSAASSRPSLAGAAVSDDDLLPRCCWNTYSPQLGSAAAEAWGQFGRRFSLEISAADVPHGPQPCRVDALVRSVDARRVSAHLAQHAGAPGFFSWLPHDDLFGLACAR